MHILIAILGAIAAIGYWMYRARDAKDTARDLFEMGNDVRLAAKRFRYKQKTNVHPVDSVEDARLLAAGLMIVAAETNGSVTAAEQSVMKRQAVEYFGCSTEDAAEMISFGHWIAAQGNKDETTRRMIKRVVALGGKETLPDLIEMVSAVGTVDKPTLDDGVEELVERLKRAQH